VYENVVEVEGVCKKSGETLFCQYDIGCYEINMYFYGTGCDVGTCTCTQLLDICIKYGGLYTGVVFGPDDYVVDDCASSGGKFIAGKQR